MNSFVVGVPATFGDNAPLLVIQEARSLYLATCHRRPSGADPQRLASVAGPYFADEHANRVGMLGGGQWRWHDASTANVQPIAGLPAAAQALAADARGGVYWALARGGRHWLLRTTAAGTEGLIWTPVPIRGVRVNASGRIALVTNSASHPYETCTLVLKFDGRLIRTLRLHALAWIDAEHLWGSLRTATHLQGVIVNTANASSCVVDTAALDLATEIAYPSGPPDPYIIDNFASRPLHNSASEHHHHWRDRHSGNAIVSSLRSAPMFRRPGVGTPEPSRRRNWEIDGSTLSGLQAGQGRTLVVYLIGGPGEPVLDRYSPIVGSIVESGRTVWVPSLSGYGGQGTARRRSTNGRWGHVEVSELRALINVGRAEGYSTLCVFGHSYGAYLALQLEAADVDAVAAWAPFTGPQALWTETPSSRILLHQWGLSDGADRAACLEVPRSTTSPTPYPPSLMMTGDYDEHLPLTASVRREIVSRLRVAGSRHRRLPIGHTAFWPNAADLVSRTVLEFLDEIDG